MTSAIDPSKPIGPVAYTADVRANFAAAKAEIEALQALINIHPNYVTISSPDVTSGTSMEVDVFSGNATGTGSTGDANLQSGNASGGASGNTGVFSGQASGNTGVVNVSSGDSSGGSSGAVLLASGGAGGGNSGDVTISTGAALGTRGNIVLDAPAITHLAATFGPDPSGGTTYGFSAEAFNIMASNSANSQMGAWLYSADASAAGIQSAGCGVGTGNAQTGGTTGDMWAYSGNVQSGPGNSGTVYLWSGDVVDGRSGDAYVAVGAANGTGTRGNIVLDAPRITTPDGQLFYLAPAPGQDIGMESSDTRSLGTDSGGLWMGTSDAGAKAGDISIYGGASLGANTKGANVGIYAGDARTGNANGGDITLGVGSGVGTGTRGNIVLDANQITSNGHINVVGTGTNWLWFQSADGTDGPSGGFGGMSGSPNPGYASAEVWFGTGDTTNANSGAATLQTGNATNGKSGNIQFVIGQATGAGHASGDLYFRMGPVTDGAVLGNIVIENYKTADPHVPGALWCDPAAGRVLKVSAG